MSLPFATDIAAEFPRTGCCILGDKLKKMKHKLHNRCSNNEAEQRAIVKALQAIKTVQINNNTPRTIMIHRQQDNTGVPQKHEKTKTPGRRNQKEDYCAGERKLEH
jgi:ribonuclease HI